MKSSIVTGGAGVRLHVTETSNPSGRPLLFIHGFSQCALAWNRQLHSDLGDTFRLVAFDLRGHGLSDKPREGYTDSQPCSPRWTPDSRVSSRASSRQTQKKACAHWAR